MARTSRRRTKPFGEREFYLEEFRGRSVLIALSPAASGPRLRLGRVSEAVADLVRNRTRVLLWWPCAEPEGPRRLLQALRARRSLRPWLRGPTPPVVSLDELNDEDDAQRLREAVWLRMRRRRVSVLAVPPGAAFPAFPLAVATALRIPKVVLLDPTGGVALGRQILSFADENALETLLQEGEAEWAGLGDRRDALAAIRAALQHGVESVNVCTPGGIVRELFTYSGSGTLFTQGDYCRVEPLGIDAFGQAERLLAQGVREGALKPRSASEIAAVLAAGFGALVSGRHLAGIAALLTHPYATERAGEVAGLYTITRFKGEGLGARLVDRVLVEAATAGLDYVFACALERRARRFFQQMGFTRVRADELPAAKWFGYDKRRQARLACFKRVIAAPETASASREPAGVRQAPPVPQAPLVPQAPPAASAAGE
ncbi:MAG TPA: GNAT family N-acetyltransferase [Candidatus Limnocylindria bacterium]|nr:GNAT family N-acetyltransferase [Candidatus Limnocylindria bacterium]